MTRLSASPRIIARAALLLGTTAALAACGGRDGRAAATNIIPASTGAATAQVQLDDANLDSRRREL